MKLFLVIASVAMICHVVAYSDQDMPGTNYVGGYSYGYPSYAVPTYALPSYGGIPTYGGVPSYGGLSSYGGVPSYGGVTSYGVLPNYGGSSGYGELSSYSVSQGAEVAPGTLCQCAPTPPKICGTDSVTYSGWCNYKCAVARNPDLKLAYVGECRVARSTSHRDNEN